MERIERKKIAKQLAKFIVQKRGDYSQAWIADQIGVSIPAMLSWCEGGFAPNIESAQKIQKFLESQKEV